MNSDIQPYDKEGAWVTNHSFLYDSAQCFYIEYEANLAALKEAETELRAKNSFDNPNDMDSFVRHETSSLWNLCYRNITAAHIFGCMAVEGFLNYYGVKRLGEAFYKRNIERLGITEKLSVLMISCQGLELDQDSSLIKDVRRVFDARNSIVHPTAVRLFDLESIVTTLVTLSCKKK